MSVSAPWRVTSWAGLFAVCVAVSPLGIAAALAAAVAGCVLIALTFVDRRVATVTIAVAACVVGTWRGVTASTVDRGPGSVAGHLGPGAVVVRGVVADAGVPGRDDTILVDAHQLVTEAGEWAVTGGVVVEPLRPLAVLPGDTLDVQTTSLRAPPQRPGALSAVALERVGAVAIATAATVTTVATGGPTPARLAHQLRIALAQAVGRILPEPEATLLLGVAFGIHGRITGAVRTPLQDAGLVHLVAVSGLKVVMVAGLVNAVAAVCGWPRRRRVLVTLCVLGLYVVISGAGAAALRSGVMVGAGLLLDRDGRRPHSFALLALCAALLLAVEPGVATDVGFQLSFVGTVGILLMAGPIAARIAGPRVLAEPFAVTVAAQLATVPITAATFGVISLVGPFANAVVLPLVPVTIVVGGAGAALGTVVPALGWLPLEMASLVCRAILAVALGASSFPLAAFQVQVWPSAWVVAELVAVGAGAVAWYARQRWWPWARGGVTPVAIAAVLAGASSLCVSVAATTAALRLTVLDVGNGVAVLIRPPGGGLILVDGGPDGPALLTALGRALSPLDRHLDAVVLTATDRATSAAVGALLGHYDVSSLLVSQPLPPALQSVAASLAGAGTRVVVAGAAAWTMGGASVRCIPSAPLASSACVLQVTDGASTALVTGNLAAAAQDELAAVQGARLGAGLLVAPTTSAPSAALLGSVRPVTIAVPALRAPPGLRSGGVEVSVSGRDSDVEYAAADGAQWSRQ